MFKIKFLLAYEANFQQLVMPICIIVPCTQKFRNDLNYLTILLTKKNTAKDLSAIIKYLRRINLRAKNEIILVTSVQKFINLLAGNIIKNPL